MYQLVSRIQDGLGELKNLLESHICNQGLTAVAKCGDAAVNVSKLTEYIYSIQNMSVVFSVSSYLLFCFRIQRSMYRQF